MTSAKSTLVTNATALMVATIGTSVIGLLFWAFATRLYDPADVGLGTAQISAASLVATFGQLSLGSVFNRYLPNAGKYSQWIIRRVFAVVTGFSVLLAVILLALGFGESYLPNLTSKLIFVVAVPILALFVVQDAALLGLGAATIVPIENVLFSIAKVILLPVMAVAAASVGIFASWVIPAAVAVAAVAYYIQRKHLSDPTLATHGTALPPRSQLWPLLGKQYIGNVVGTVVFLSVPLIIISQLGADASGYLSIPWMISGAFSSLIGNITQSFSYDVRSGRAVSKATARRLFLLLGVVVGVGGLACAALAPVVLDILAPGYAGQSTTLLRLVALAAPLQGVFILLVTFWWLEGKFELFAIVQTVNAAMTLVLTWYLAPTLGVSAAGIALLGPSLLFALGSIWPLARRLRMVRRGDGHLWTPEHADTPADAE
jgi:O-antigen/teichoic acid export membrane protein